MYLKQLKSYVPPSPKPATDLSYKINTPQPPPQPTLLSSDANVESVLAVDKAEVDQWEPLVDPIDDPKNFVRMFLTRSDFILILIFELIEEWDFESDRDEGYYPKRLVAPGILYFQLIKFF